MKRLFALILMMSIGFSLIGGPIDETTAKQLAQSFWKDNNTMAVRNGKVFKKKMDDARFVNVAAQYGYSEFFIFNNTAGKGYVIMAADDCVTPILGYSYENNFDNGELPPNFKAWLDGYAEQIRAAVAIKAQATAEIRSDWECLRQSKPLPIKSEKAVSPLVQAKWNQAPYYNAQCPYDDNANVRTVTGCVATAMAQIMKYWSYPMHGLGNHSYVPSSHPEYGTLYVDFSAVNYQWSNMPNSVTSDNSAVATLMYHCGVSVDMMYGIPTAPDYGSAAYIIDYGSGRACAEIAFKTYFDYKSTLHGVKKNDYSDSQWIALLKTELDNARPMLYGGFSSSGGHAFVCDGYDNNNYFHFNWGWGGTYNDYFYINSLNPGSYNYSQNQQAIIGIEPNQSGGGGGGGTTGFALSYYSNPVMSETEYWFYEDLSVYAEVANRGDESFTGYIGAGVFRKNENDEYVFLKVMKYWDRTSNPLQSGKYIYGNLECQAGPPYLPGSYGVAMLYSLDGQLWNFIDRNNYQDAFFDIIYEQDIETFSDFQILTGDYLYYGTDATVNVSVWNSGSETFYGRFRVNLSNLDGSWAQNIGIYDCTDGLGADLYYVNGINFTGEITVQPGSYYLELAYQNSGESTWYYAGAYAYQNPVRVEVVAASVNSDQYEANNTASNAYRLPCNITGNLASISTTGANLHNGTDIDFYKIQLDAGMNYFITPRLHDSYNTGNSTYYTVDAMYAYSTDGVNWSDFYDDVMETFFVRGGSTLYFWIMPYFEGKTGTYQLDIKVVPTTGIDESEEHLFSVYPNPVKDVVNVDCKDIEQIYLFNAVGQNIESFSVEGDDKVQIDMSGLPSGLYILQAVSQGRTLTRQIVKNN
ncbi:MAG: thiol protease/hemagglutinin PrtT [Bacteroidales bacterium]|nr:thiol protease/hemagglutinin PrtT [Bacteroidales bacterium]